MNSLIKHRQLIIRLGLAFVFLWAGISAIVNPENWIGFMPTWLRDMVPVEWLLRAHAAIDIAVGAAIAFNFMPKITYALASLLMLSIIVFYGVDDVTFRDVALFTLSAGLWLDSLAESRVSS